VTACVPTYNSGPDIDLALGSLLAQDYPDLEILVSDDCSDDDTADRCRALLAGNRKARVVRQERRLGWVENLNFLLHNSQGKFCFFLGHDDWVRKDCVTLLVSALTSHPGAVLAYGDLEGVSLDGRVSVYSLPDFDHELGEIHGALQTIADRNDWVAYRGLFRPADALVFGGFRKELVGERFADKLFVLKMSLMGGFVRVPEVLYYKQWKADSLSLLWKRGAVFMLQLIPTYAAVLARLDITWRDRSRLFAAFLGAAFRRALQRLGGDPVEGNANP
jgi:glycosyltransferase involved in cell wall biosynthesis